MNIHEKIMLVKYELMKRNIKKSGYNKFVGYNYYELSDIVPHITELLIEYKISMMISCTESGATLELTNSEKPEEKVTCTMPMAAVNLKGAHAMQNMGAQTTYLRRYILMMAFDIVENDFYDAVQGKDEEEREGMIQDVRNACKKIIERGKATIEELMSKFPMLNEMKTMFIEDLKTLRGIILKEVGELECQY